MTGLPLKPVRVLLADDHALFRAGIRALLEKVPGIEVVGNTSGGGLEADLKIGRETIEVATTSSSSPPSEQLRQ